MKHVKHLPNLDDWNTELPNAIQDAFTKALQETLHAAFEDNQTYIYFPIMYAANSDELESGTDGLGGVEVTDPLIIYLRVGLDSESEKPTYSFNLRDNLNEYIQECAEEGSNFESLNRISISLRSLADEIDAAWNKFKTANEDASPCERGE